MPLPQLSVMVLATVLLGCGRGVLDDGAGRLGGGAVDASADVADVRTVAEVRTDVRADLPAPIDVAPPPDLGGGDSWCGNQCGRVDTVYVEANCTAVVPCSQSAGAVSLHVIVDGYEVPYSHSDGWDYVDDSMSTISLNGIACEALAGSQTVTISQSCLIP